MKSERLGTWLLGLAFMLWVGVELWRSRLPAVPEPIGVKELLYALDQVISEPTQMDEASLTLSRTDEDAVGPIAVDLSLFVVFE